MEVNQITFQKAGLLLLFLASASVMLATIFYQFDKAIVIHVNQLRTPFWDTIWLSVTNSAGIIGYGAAALALFIAVNTKTKEAKAKYYSVALAGIISGLAVTAIKYAVQRTRPFHLFTSIHALGPGGGWSYPSGHTCDAFFFASILMLTFPEKRLLVLGVWLWAVMVGVSRVYLGVHYPSDVIAGIALSCSSSFLACWIVMKYFSKNIK